MATQYTSLLGLALPVTGELSGTWGDVVNDSITSLLDSAVAGTTTLNTDADVTLSTTTGAANQSRQAIILWTANGTTTRNITAPAQSKAYVVINKSAGTQSIVFRGVGPTTGVTIAKDEAALVAWNGSDFIKISNINGAGQFTDLDVTGTTTLDALTASTALALNASKEIVSVTNTGTGNNVLATSPTLTTPNLGTPSAVTLTNATDLPVSTGISGLGTGVATFLATPSSANLAAAVTDETGSGALVFATSPSLTTPTIGAATATSINKVALTAPATGATLTLSDGSSLITSGGHSLTLTTTGATNVTFPTTGTLATTADTVASISFGTTGLTPNTATTGAVTVAGTLAVANGGTGITSFGTGVATALGQNVTGSGGIVLATSPTLTTPTLGAATATSINKVALTAPATGSTLTIADGKTLTANSSLTLAGVDAKTLTVNNSLTLAGTDATTMTFPSTSATIARTDAAQTFTGTQTFSGAVSVQGNTTLGDASTDTVQVNGYMGVGGLPSSDTGIYLTNTALTGTAQFGVLSAITGSSAATTRIVGFNAIVASAAASFTVADLVGFRASTLLKGAGSTVTNTHGVLVLDQTQGTNNYGVTSLVSSGSNKWNIYASGTANNAFAGNVRIGSTTAPTNALDVTGAMTVSGNTTLGDASTDTVTVNGYMGVGGAPAASQGLRVVSTALTGIGPIGLVSSVTAPATATSSITAGYFEVATEAASFTTTTAIAIRAANAIKGAGSAITNQHGVYVADQTQGTNNYGITSLVSSGSNKWNIYASGTANNYFAGKVALNSSAALRGFNSILGSSTALALQIEGSSVDSSWMSIVRAGATATQAGILLGKTRGGIGGEGVVVNNDGLGSVTFAGSDGTNMISSGAIGAVVSGIPSTGFIPSALVFYNSSTTQNTVERLRLAPTEAVFNDPGNDYDFRVESDTNTHALFVQGSDGNVGIGTSSPSYLLQANGASAVAGISAFDTRTAAIDVGARLFLGGSYTGTTTSIFGAVKGGKENATDGNNAGYLSFQTISNGGTLSEKLRIDSSGNVGIGTSSPKMGLHVAASSGNPVYGGLDGNTNAFLLRGNVYYDITNVRDQPIATGFQTQISLQNSDGSIRFATSTSSVSVGSAATLAERLRIDSSGNVKIGGTAARATTAGTNHLSVFNGTAPVGTLSNGISIYSSAGEAYVMDAAGNATLFSPHDAETNEWIFKSKHTPTGKVLRIDVEKLLRFVNDHFGLDAVQEFIEP